MAKNRQDKIDKLAAQIAQQQEQLKLERKKQADEQRKAKDSRQKRRHGFLESALPDTIGLTDEQYKIFLEKHIANDFGRKALASIIAEQKNKPTEKQGNATAHDENSTAETT